MSSHVAPGEQVAEKRFQQVAHLSYVKTAGVHDVREEGQSPFSVRGVQVEEVLDFEVGVEWDLERDDDTLIRA